MRVANLILTEGGLCSCARRTEPADQLRHGLVL